MVQSWGQLIAGKAQIESTTAQVNAAEIALNGVREEARVGQRTTLDVLNAHLEPLGRRLGPDPSGSESCTVGGMIGGNSAGARSIRYGMTADHVERLRVVFAHGEAAELGREPRPATDEEPADFKGLLVRRLGTLLDWHDELIARRASRSDPMIALRID